MILQNLHINRVQYGEDKGKLRGTIKFSNGENNIEINIDNSLSEKLVAICADELVIAAKAAANNMICNVLEQEHKLLL